MTLFSSLKGCYGVSQSTCSKRASPAEKSFSSCSWWMLCAAYSGDDTVKRVAYIFELAELNLLKFAQAVNDKDQVKQHCSFSWNTVVWDLTTSASVEHPPLLPHLTHGRLAKKWGLSQCRLLSKPRRKLTFPMLFICGVTPPTNTMPCFPAYADGECENST